jgi:dTDP-4-amino-4,6-dideoxygalactose transaminase
MPNLNAALACAQLEQLDSFIENKRELAKQYNIFFTSKGINFRTELPNTKANYWLMCLELENKKDRDLFLKETNDNKVMTRPIWQLIFKTPIYSSYQRDAQENALFLENRIVNIPSSVR